MRDKRALKASVPAVRAALDDVVRPARPMPNPSRWRRLFGLGLLGLAGLGGLTAAPPGMAQSGLSRAWGLALSSPGAVWRSFLDRFADRGYVKDFATFAQALTAGVGKSLRVNSVIAISANTTVPATLQLEIEKGGSFSVATGVTLTINSPFSAGLYQVFSCTGTGAVIFGTGVVTQVYPEWFGGFADAGTTDNYAPTQLAVNSVPWGGRLKIPAGWRKFTDEVLLHAGLTVEGDGAADFADGDPPAYSSVPTYLWQATANKSIFVISGGMSNISIEKMAFSPTLVPSHAATTDGKYGIKLAGTFPEFVWNLTFKNLIFYNLERGISCVDPNAGTESPPYDYDWSVAPVDVSNCRFLYPQTGVYIDTNNADLWTFSHCVFGVPSGGQGVYLYRFGIMHFVDCAGGGDSVSTNRLIRIYGNGVNGVDNILIDTCQAETLTQFITLDPGGTYAYRFTLTCRNCVAEMGADVYLGNTCHFVSMHSRWTANLYVDDADVKISSLLDYFGAGNQFSFLTGGPSTSFVNLQAGPDTASAYANIAYLNGRFTQHDTGAPVGSTFKVGDRVINSVPAVGQPKAWVCTVAGTPGTWVSEGNL